MSHEFSVEEVQELYEDSGSKTLSSELLGDSNESMLGVWMLRILIRAGGFRAFVKKIDEVDERLLRILGLSSEQDYSSEKEIKKLRKQLSSSLLGLEKRKISHDPIIQKNINKITGLLGVDETERELLTFSIYYKIDDSLRSCFKILGELKLRSICLALSQILELDVDAIRHALRPQGVLPSTGLLGIDISLFDSEATIEVAEPLVRVIEETQPNFSLLFRRFFHSSPSPLLERRDFRHISGDFDLLKTYLSAVLKSKRRGVNVLIYGSPGTGKTQFVRVLSRALRATLHEVSHEDRDGDPMTRLERLNAYRLCQHIFDGRDRNMVLFDEMDDTFPSKFEAAASQGRADNKSCINRLLETNSLPALWVTNNPGGIDEAYLRRFDYILHMGMPPVENREKILKEMIRNIPVEQGWVRSIARQEKLSPAHLERATHFASTVCGNQAGKFESVFERAVTGHLELLGQPRVNTGSMEKAIKYDLDLVKADHDLQAVVNGLTTTHQGRLCLYGPPGTGKTAFAHHLGSKLGCPVLVRRPSDIFSKFIGESEANLASAFRDAQAESAILVFDEAETYLSDRQAADQKWLVSVVNEFLMQLESYSGIVVCTTNLKDQLDSAVNRRFDLKIMLDYLDMRQTWEMFCQLQDRLGIKLPRGRHQQAMKAKLGKLANMTPGDFAAVARKAGIMTAIDSPDAVYEALMQEAQAKPGVMKHAVGFV